MRKRCFSFTYTAFIGDVTLHHHTLDVIRIMPASIISAKGLHQAYMTLILTFPFDKKLAQKFMHFIL